MTTNQTYGWKNTEPTDIHSIIVPYLRRLFVELRSPPARAIDLGCGNGAATSEIANLGYQVVGLDVSADGIQLARSKWPSISWLCHSLDERINSEDIADAFDIAYSLDVIEHLYSPRNLFRRAQEVLKHDGYLVIATPYHGYLKNLALALTNATDRHFTVSWDGGHIKFFSRATLCAMAKEFGFVPVCFRGLGRVPGLWKSMVIVFTKD